MTVLCIIDGEELRHRLARTLCAPRNPDLTVCGDSGRLPLWKTKLDEADRVLKLLRKEAV